MKKEARLNLKIDLMSLPIDPEYWPCPLSISHLFTKYSNIVFGACKIIFWSAGEFQLRIDAVEKLFYVNLKIFHYTFLQTVK